MVDDYDKKGPNKVTNTIHAHLAVITKDSSAAFP